MDGAAPFQGRRAVEDEFALAPNAMTGVFIVGWDGGGNPFGIEAVAGRIG
jgi:hypothetical protein